MKRPLTSRTDTAFSVPAKGSILLAVALLLCTTAGPASAQRKERLGQEVVDSICAACHATGKDQAPRIGDRKAWAPRAAQGLTALTQHAISGIRTMPAHGGAAGVSDIEIERAIIAMVNQSGGRWTEPVGGATPAVLRSSQQVVQGQCAKCHQEGLEGAPRIGDRVAWIPRLKKGLDSLVASAIHGHGGMPARGGLPDLSDEEIRGAIVHMFNFGIPLAPAPVKVSTNPYHRLVGETDVYLGVISAERLREAKTDGRAGAVGTIPGGKDVVHINISLADARSKVSLTDAEVTVKVFDGQGGESRVLDLMAENNAVSYGGFFRTGKSRVYTITAQIRRPGMPETLEARFDYQPR